jgi:DNA topoisomerase VI subunit A
VVKFGKPGRLIVEGRKDNVDAYLTRIRNLHWQKMSIKTSNDREISIPKEHYDLTLQYHNFDNFIIVEDDAELQQLLKEKSLEHVLPWN